MSVTMQCMSGFLEAFQKIADIAETNNAGLRPFGIALRRYCLRQRCIESRLRSFNSQITDCLVTPLSDRLEEWRRTSNQMDRDSVKELRKAKSELQRAMLEAEKCKKRIKRKWSRSHEPDASDERSASLGRRPYQNGPRINPRNGDLSDLDWQLLNDPRPYLGDTLSS
ncbi:hypothetical protein ACTXT7_001591 [Hymenolepis weldensis]